MIQKTAATMGETVGLGAGSGAAMGALTALLSDNPDVTKVLRSALVGGAGGAVIGAGAKTLKGGAGVPAASPDIVSGNPKEMNLALAAMSGWLPGVGPALHGGLSQGVGQGVASGAASIAGPLAVAIPVLLKAKGSMEALPRGTRPAAMLASILGATGAAYAGNRMRAAEQTKEAAEIVRKTKMVEEHHDHCPHCDHEFREKGYPRPTNLPEDQAEREKVLNSGDYDEVCPACGGIVDQKEMTDEEIESACTGYFFSGDPTSSDKLRKHYEAHRGAQRRRRAEREKSAAAKCPGCGRDFPEGEPLPDVDNCEVCERFGPPKSASADRDAQTALNGSDIPGDVYFFTDGKGRATACLGDWHEKDVWELVKQFGAANWENWEVPDDSEIGRPEWATKELSNQSPPAEKSASIILRAALLGGIVKSAKLRPAEERLQRLAERRGECGVCWKPNREGRVCDCGKTVGAEKSAKEAPGIRQARNATHTDPTPSQASAGNYAKGEFDFKGVTIKIENPKGTERRGYNATGAITWRRVMHADYGYVKGTKAVDGDAIDVFVGPDHDSDLIVAIDQYRGDTFDETKFVVGVTTQEQGEKLYLRHYPKGWSLGPVSTTTVPQFKAWLRSGAHTKPFKGQMVKVATDESHSTPADALLSLLGITTSKRLLERGVEQTGGVQRFVHGTSRDAQKSILREGLLPSKGGNPEGGAAIVGSPKFLSGSRGRVHVAKDNIIGRNLAADPHAALAEAGRLARESGAKLSAGEAREVYQKGMLLPSLFRRQTHVGGAMSHADFARIFEQDPDHIPGVAFRTTQAIPPGNLTQNRAGIVQILKAIDAKGLPAYLKSNPRRAIGGVAALAAGGLVANATANPVARIVHDLREKYDEFRKSAGLRDTALRWAVKGLMSPTARGIMRSKPFQQVERAVVSGAGNVADHVLQHPKTYGPLARHAGKFALTGGAGVIGAAATAPVWGPKLFDAFGRALDDPDGRDYWTPPTSTGMSSTSGIAAARG